MDCTLRQVYIHFELKLIKRSYDAGERYSPDVLNYDDLRKMIPALDGHPKITDALLRWLEVDKVNEVHGKCCDTPGPEFVKRLLLDEFGIKLRVDGTDVLENLPRCDGSRPRRRDYHFHDRCADDS